MSGGILLGVVLPYKLSGQIRFAIALDYNDMRLRYRCIAHQGECGNLAGFAALVCAYDIYILFARAVIARLIWYSVAV